MDNAMVKRGIGAVVLAIIAALLLGYLLKDKSRERQEVVDMKLPGAPEISIPSLSDATNKVTDSTASLVGEAKDTVSNAGSAVVASASGALSSVTDGASNAVEAVTNSASSATQAVGDTVSAATDNSSSSNPGFSFRPPAKNEEQQINSGSESSAPTASVSNDTVVASNQNTETKKFKPIICLLYTSPSPRDRG